MSPQRVFGYILLVAGIVLVIVGLNASDSVADQFSSFFTGHYTNETVWFIAGGAAMGVVGVMMALFGGHHSET